MAHRAARPRCRGRIVARSTIPNSPPVVLQGGRAGGRARSRPRTVLSKAPDIHFTSVGDVIDLLAATASQTRRGEIDVKIGNMLTYIAGTAINAVLKGDLEKRLAVMERALAALEKKEKS